MDLAFIKSGAWADVESRLAAAAHLPVYPANERIFEILEEEVDASEFTLAQILGAFEQQPELIEAFSSAWSVDCAARDYGEEWEGEGEQQGERPSSDATSIVQGFLITHALFLLYAQQAPSMLHDFVRRRGIPHAKKVAADVQRVFDVVMFERGDA